MPQTAEEKEAAIKEALKKRQAAAQAAKGKADSLAGAKHERAELKSKQKKNKARDLDR